MYRHLLVPIDGTPLSSATVEQAVAFALSAGARLTFFHAQVDSLATQEGAPMRSLDPAAYAELVASNARALLAKAMASARAAKVESSTVAASTDRPADAILEAAHTQGCDLIFMASHGRRGLKGMLMGSVTQKVLQQTQLPVLIAAVESNAPASAEQQALTMIRDEHRSLDAVINGLRFVLDQALLAAHAPDFALLRAMLSYIEHFPERLHHPKEEAYLFRKLRARAPEYGALLDELAFQHREGTDSLAELHAALAAAEADTDRSLAGFSTLAERFALNQRTHMSAEEKLVMPAASRYLTPADWTEIVQAFSENGDPRFGSKTDASFTRMFAKLIHLAGSPRQGALESA